MVTSRLTKTCINQDMYFDVPEERRQWLLANKKEGSAYKIIDGVVMGRLASACWFTNLDHGKRHQELLLDTMEHNLKFNKRLRKKLEKDYGKSEYPRFDNYDVIEIPFVECIPSDYDGVMAVPITFLDKYNPDQFKILEGSNRYGILNTWGKNEEIRAAHSHGNNINGKATYFRIHIQKK